MKQFRASLLTALLACGAASAWTPAIDEPTAKAIVDGAYLRSPNVPTSSAINLLVQNGAFQAATGTVGTYAGGEGCLQNWLRRPADFATLGSRPTRIEVVGQGDAVKLAAEAADAELKNISAAAALAAGKKVLPDGHIRAFVTMAGLSRQESRDAYRVVVLGAENKLLRPYRSAFLNDWKQGGEGNRWGGTMVYYFDLSKAGIDPNATLPLVVRTEADSDCVYRVNVPLGSFR